MTELPPQLEPLDVTDADRAGLDLLAAVDALGRVADSDPDGASAYRDEAVERLNRIKRKDN